MNADTAIGQWKQLSGGINKHGRQPTADDFVDIETQLAGNVQERNGVDPDVNNKSTGIFHVSL